MIKSLVVILILTIQGWTMEPYYPEKMEIKSKDAKLMIVFSEKTDPRIVELPKKKLNTQKTL